MLNNLESGKGGILTGLEMVRDIFIGAPPPPTPATTVKVFVAGLLEIEACPQTPFPRQNDREVMIAMTNTWWALTWVWPLVPLLAIFFVFVLCTCCCACRGRAATPVAKAKSKSKKIA